MHVFAEAGTITHLRVDALVCPGDESGSVCGTIARHAGPAIEVEARRVSPVPVGAAAFVAAGALPAGRVVYVPVTADPEGVRRATRAALLAAVAGGVEALAIPALGLGGALDADECARAMAEELRAHRGELPTHVYLVDPSERVVAAWRRAIERLR